MNHQRVFMIFLSICLIPINYIYAEEESAEVMIEFPNGNFIDVDSGATMIRAYVTISNYNPHDGYYYMEVKKMSDETIVKDSEILPSYIDDGVYGVQILHYLDPSGIDEGLLGDYELRVYSEFGTGESTVPFSIIKSSQTPIVSQNSKILEVSSEEDSNEDLQFDDIVTESEIPEWIHDIFVWFANGEIGDDDLLSAIKYLVESDIIVLDS